MTKDEALKLALEALEIVEPHTFPNSNAELFSRSAITAILEALAEQPAQPEQKPVAYGMWDTMLGKGNRMMMVRLDKGQDGCTVPLYTTPPQREWVGLTDGEVDPLSCEMVKGNKSVNWLCRAIDAKLKQKNGFAEEKNT